MSDKEQAVSIDLKDMGIKKSNKVNAWRTSGSYATGEHWAPVSAGKVTSGTLEAILPANSITTFQI